jgi:type IV pilus assembly protein PilX
VVLIVALILLVVISLLAITSLRGAGSTESVLGNVRTTALASEAAEIALKYCEAGVIELSGGAGPYTTTLATANIWPASSTPQWPSTTLWDSAASAATETFVIPLGLVNQTGTTATYKRAPECMVERLPSVFANGSASSVSNVVVTVRGFGPEVPALASGAARGRPEGTEVWLQSTIAF